MIGGGSASLITQCWQSIDDIGIHMLNFLENHDEQRIASEFFAKDARKAFPALLVSALMRTNPFMVYQGQMLGVDGMEDAGFSGSDGRTTIFDYWSIDQFRRWRNNGLYDTNKLTKEEKEIFNYYTKVLTLCNSEKAISDGQFYDLMYANYENQQMDTNRLFGFIRKDGEETILIVANFSEEPMQASVRIPAHAIEFLNMRTGARFATDLLTGATHTIDIYPDQTIDIKAPANGGIVLKF